MIRFACCSDTHDRLPPALDAGGGIVAWLHAGDIYEGPHHGLTARARQDDWLRREDWKYGEPLRQWTAKQAVPVYAVRGNHDSDDYWKIFDCWQDVSGRIVQAADHLFVAGVGWHGKRYFDTPGESDLEPVCEMVLRQVRRIVMPGDRVVLLTHYPASLPELFPAAEPGSAYRCVRRLVEELAPMAVVQGHMHSLFGLNGCFQCSGGWSLVLNPGPMGEVLCIDAENRINGCTLGKSITS